MAGKTGLWISAIFSLLGYPAWADPVLQVASDLNKDGVAEVFSLFGGEDGEADLLISWPSGAIHLPDIAWQGGMAGQEPTLDLAPNGSVLLTARNDSIGRDRWDMTVTIAYRNDVYVAAGMTYRWRDTLDLENYGVCDVNLLTGRGFLTIAEADAQDIGMPRGGIPITEWSDSILWESPCVPR